METTEFNLSERIIGNKTIHIKNVKEAIRLIKLNPDKINEIVGDKLK